MDKKKWVSLLIGWVLFGLQIAIDIYYSDAMVLLGEVNANIPLFNHLYAGPHPALFVIIFTGIRAVIYTDLIKRITGSQSYAHLFFTLHVGVFTFSTFLFLIRKFLPTGIIIPPKVNEMLFLLTNTPFLFLASLPAYYYLYRSCPVPDLNSSPSSLAPTKIACQSLTKRSVN